MEQLEDKTFPEGPIAIGCETVIVKKQNKSVLGRVSIVTRDGTVIYDVIISQNEEIVDYRTNYSGIKASDMNRSLPFKTVQEHVRKIIKVDILILNICTRFKYNYIIRATTTICLEPSYRWLQYLQRPEIA